MALLTLYISVCGTTPSPAQGVIHTQVTASVTKPEAVCSTVTNTFHFVRHSP